MTFCAELGRSEGDELGGTAAEVDHWLLLEYPAPWGRRAVEENGLPEDVRNWLSQRVAARPRSRLLFVRRRNSGEGASGEGASGEGGPHLYLECSPADPGGAVRGLSFESPRELVASDPTGYQSLPEADLLLTCTNARRDRCCARLGVPVYQTLERLRPELAWECTHTGGHRYAASMVSLPDGALYGRVDASAVPELIARRRAGEIALDYYRGRSFYPKPAQAADVWVRREKQLRALEAVKLLSCEPTGSGLDWRVRLGVAGSLRQALELGVRGRSVQRLASCSPEKTKASTAFDVDIL